MPQPLNDYDGKCGMNRGLQLQEAWVNHFNNPLRVLAIALFIVGCLSLMNWCTVGSAQDIGSSGDVASNKSDESYLPGNHPMSLKGYRSQNIANPENLLKYGDNTAMLSLTIRRIANVASDKPNRRKIGLMCCV